MEQPGSLIYLTYFNAGLRIFDIKDPLNPKETGWFIPPTPVKRYGPQPPNDLVNQTEDVLVDTGLSSLTRAMARVRVAPLLPSSFPDSSVASQVCLSGPRERFQ